MELGLGPGDWRLEELALGMRRVSGGPELQGWQGGITLSTPPTTNPPRLFVHSSQPLFIFVCCKMELFLIDFNFDQKVTWF